MKDQVSDPPEINVNDLFSIEGKVALVTGGSSGIGLMIAKGYIEAGARVYITSRKKEVCERVASMLSQIGPCIAIPADIATSQGRGVLVREFKKREQKLSILVNNAGTSWGAKIEEYPDTAFQKLMALNVNAVFAMTRDLLPLLEAAGTFEDPARIINIGSMDGIRVPTTQPVPVFAYASSKAAVHHLTRTLAVDLAPRHITVNAVAPGYYESKMTDYLRRNLYDDLVAACPLGRIGKPAEMAGIAIYLASRAGAYTNGAIIPVDGGTSLA